MLYFIARFSTTTCVRLEVIAIILQSIALTNEYYFQNTSVMKLITQVITLSEYYIQLLRMSKHNYEY